MNGASEVVGPDDPPPPCLGKGHLFYPTIIGEGLNVSERARETWVPPEAAALCDSCPYKCQCLTVAMVGEDWGVWAGTSARDRRVARHKIANGELTLDDYLSQNGCR